MQLSGYNQHFRLEIIKSALHAFNTLKNDEKDGKRPMYRRKTWKRAERRKENQKKKADWYNKEKYESVLFIPPTPSSSLKTEIEKEIQKLKIKIKVIEKSGKSIKKTTQKSDPFGKTKCTKKECWICKAENGGNCRTPGVTYKVTCATETECNKAYTGNTARSAYTRGEEHRRDFENKVETSVLWKHHRENHAGRDAIYKIDIIDKCRNNPLERQLYEAVRIRRMDTTTSLNNKGEWNAIKLPRMQIT